MDEFDIEIENKIKSKQEKRKKTGARVGIVNLLSNILLSFFKAVVGILSNSIAITADALNNLTDCISSIVTLISFRAASKEKDKEHPYGHGRIEYLSGFLVAILIAGTGITILYNSVRRIIWPEAIEVNLFTIIILVMSIIVKLFMTFYIRRVEAKMDSNALEALWKDNFSDVLVTSVMLIGLLFAPFTSFPIDAVLGIGAGIIILRSGYISLSDGLGLLIGEGLTSKEYQTIYFVLDRYIERKYINDIFLHDYGPEQQYLYVELYKMPEETLNSFRPHIDEIRKEILDKVSMDVSFYIEIE